MTKPRKDVKFSSRRLSRPSNESLDGNADAPSPKDRSPVIPSLKPLLERNISEAGWTDDEKVN